MNLLEQEKSELEENLAEHLDINGVYDALNYIVKKNNICNAQSLQEMTAQFRYLYDTNLTFDFVSWKLKHA